ncbi:MAG TPA: hypothetical protein VGQ83_15570, partial [Polyangia bacterium]
NLSIFGYRYDLKQTEIRVRTRRLSVVGATFLTAGVQSGDTLVVTGDGTTRGATRDGTYTVARVSSETDLEVTVDLPGDKTEPATITVTAPDGTARCALSATVQSVTASQFCYEFAVDNITLASTLAPAGGEEGWNYVQVTIGQVPQDAPLDFGEFRVGCVKARFVRALDLKTPGEGVMSIPEESFKRSSNPDNPHDPEVFDPARDCIVPSG